MKIKKEDLPVVMEGPGLTMRLQSGFGHMDAVYHHLPKGMDFTPVLKGLGNDSCHCPHWAIFLRVRSVLFMTMVPKRHSKLEIFFTHLQVTPLSWTKI